VIETNSCVECTANEHCAGETPICDVESNTCVQCTGHGNCGGETPVCNGSSNTCGPCTGANPIEVVFSCTSITAYSPCKDLSNVVLQFADGTRERVGELVGGTGTFAGTGANAEKVIVGVWVKAGKNGSSPGLGEYFAAPTGSCQ
jgi:hypothetical protein